MTRHEAPDDTTRTDAGEPPGEDIDEQFRSLLEGLRTSLPAVQVLFAFLLVAPFQTEFATNDTTLASFSVAFFAAGLSSVLLIAPSVHQRVRAPASGLRRHSKRHLVIATWLTIVGTVVMGVAIVATILMISTIVFDRAWAIAATTAVGAVVAWAWFYLPLVTFRR